MTRAARIGLYWRCAALLIASARPTSAQQSPAPASPPQPVRSLPSMMRGPELYGRELQRVRFTPDGQWIYFQWLSPGTDWRMANGLVDTDVHSRNIVRPTQRFIAREQTGWDLAVYPVENHGSLRLGSRADEYRPIFEGFESTLTRSRATGGAQ